MSTQAAEHTHSTIIGSKSPFLRGLAMAVSYIFHPVFMPPIMLYLLYLLKSPGFAGNDHMVLGWAIKITYLNVFYPLLTIFLLKALGFIKSIHMRDAKERIIPLIATMVFYFWTYHVFANFGQLTTQHISDAPLLLRSMLLGVFWGVILLFMVNIFFKVSLHTAGTGGMVGLMIVLLINSPVNMSIPICVSIIVAGIIGTARLILGEHRPSELWLGYAIGIAVQVGAWVYLR